MLIMRLQKMSKRRRAGSLPRYTEDDSMDSFEASTSSGPTSQKRRKLFDPIEVCQQLVELLRNHKKEDGTLLSESFIRIPKRRQEPAYYDVVSNPIDLIKVQQKLKMDEYEDVEDLQSDIELMVSNAKSFYKRNTQEYKDAVEMMDLFLTTKNKLLNLDDDPPSRKSTPNNKQKNSNARPSLSRQSLERNLSRKERSVSRSDRILARSESRSTLNYDDSASDDSLEDDSCPFEELLAAVMKAKDEKNKLLYPTFQLLPSRKQYPDYYEVVEQPVDLKIVTNKVQNNKYKFLFELEKDLLLMCKNACLYNEPGSHIYKQAKALRKFVQAKRIEIDTRRGTLPILASQINKNNAKNNRNSLNSSKNSLNSSRGSLNTPRHSLNSSLNSSKNSLNSSKHKHVGRPRLHPNNSRLTPNSHKKSSLIRTSSPLNSHRHGGSVNSNRHTPLSVRDRLLNSSVHRNSLLSVNRTGISPKVYKNNRLGSGTPTMGNSFKYRHKKVGGRSSGPATLRDESDVDHEDGDDDVDLSNPHWKLFETVRTAMGANGTLMSDPFWKLPSRKFYPDYFKEIKNPIALRQIRKKLVNRGYGTLSEVAGDLTIMFENAKKYNIPTSKLYKDAVRLQKLMQAKVQELLDVDQLFTEKERKKPGPKPKNLSPGGSPRGRPPKDSTLLKKRMHMLAKYMLDYTTEDGRKPMLAFIEKPSKKLYPEYYEVIAEPIDFLEIEAKIKAEQYSCEADLIKDFKLMFSNCRQFNEENSPIYEDANLLEKYLLNKVAQLKPINLTPDKPKRERVVLKPYKPRRIMSPLEKTLKSLFEAIRYFRDPKDNRQLSQTFMKLPSKLEYPDYYEVITNPIDMERISQKIRANDYENLDELVSDFVLLFDNACKYNEPDSQIYKDALLLQRFMFQTKMQLKDDENTVPDVSAIVQDIFLNLFTNVYNYQDDDGRCYSDSMADLPEHDDIDGKKVRALSLDVIKRRLDKGLYKRLDTYQEDFFACMERARTISRTDSQVFDDSIELQLYFLKQRDELCRNGELLSSPALIYTEVDARASIDDIRAEKALKESIDDDTETRCSEDSILKEINVNEDVKSEESLTSKEESIASKEKSETEVDDIKKEEASAKKEEENGVDEEDTKKDEENGVDEEEAKIKENAVIVVSELSQDGDKDKDSDSLKGPSDPLSDPLELDDSPKDPSDEPSELKEIISVNSELNNKSEKASEETNGCVAGESMTCNGRTFTVGEFVYLDAKEKGCEPHILCIERLWENNGQQMLYGNYYLRPDETYHVTTRKFLEREVFKSDSFIAVPLEDVRRKCCVVNVKYYFTMKPEGFEDEDVYVCESRYRTRLRFFKKIKIYPDNPSIKLIPRDQPLKLKRVMSVFRERIEKHKDELQELEDLEKLVDKEKPNVVAYNNMEIDDGNTYYEQFNTVCSGVIKTGDYVYVVADGGKQIIAQIDSIWETKDGKCYFRGPWFIFPADIPHNPTRLYYKNEVFLSSLEDASPIVSIIGKCHVMELSDWVIYRHTEIPETDVFIVVSMYDEINRQLKKLPMGSLKKYTHSPNVTDDEIYFFTRVLHPPKKSNKNKVVTGYILYSREVRKQVVQNNPESTFGDISRIVGSEWKSLPQSEKQIWEEKASKLNEETKALLLLEQEACGSPAPAAPPPPPPVDQIFECLWDGCDFQFEEVCDLIDHCIKDKESQGHVQAFYQENAGMDFNCFWRNCARAKKNVQPFPNITRLIRHVRDMHINKGNGRSVPPENRNKNFKPSSKPTAVSRPSSSATPNALSSSNVLSPNAQKPQEPMFIAVPPRPQRVLHSEAYIKYIEGLSAENKHITQWERNLQVTQENTPEPDVEKLKQVTAWLGRKADQHDNVVAALWALRNQLLKDTLSLHKTL